MAGWQVIAHCWLARLGRTSTEEVDLGGGGEGEGRESEKAKAFCSPFIIFLRLFWLEYISRATGPPQTSTLTTYLPLLFSSYPRPGPAGLPVFVCSAVWKERKLETCLTFTDSSKHSGLNRILHPHLVSSTSPP